MFLFLKLFYIYLLSRCNADVVMANIFKVFDPENSGVVVPTELLVAFSMSMKGTGALVLFCKVTTAIGKH